MFWLSVLIFVALARSQIYKPRERCADADKCHVVLQGGTKMCKYIRTGRGAKYHCYYPKDVDSDINLFPEIRLSDNTLTSTTITIDEDTPYAFTGLSIDDPDVDDELNIGVYGVMKLRLIATHGTLNFTNSSTQNVIGTDGALPLDTAWTPGVLWFDGSPKFFSDVLVYGTQTDLTDALATLVYHPGLNNFTTANAETTYYTPTTNAGSMSSSHATIVLDINDRGHTGAAAESAQAVIEIRIQGINDLPYFEVGSSLPTATAEDTAVTLSAGDLTVLDVDNVPGTVSGAVLRLRIDAPSGSTITSAYKSYLGSNFNGAILGGHTGTCTAPICEPLTTDEINAILAQLSFKPPQDATGTHNVLISVWDITKAMSAASFNPATTSAPFAQYSWSVSVTPINDAPVVSFATAGVLYEDIAGVLTGISFTDVESGDGGSYTVSAAPTTAAVVVLNCSSCSGVVATGAGTTGSPLQLTGTYSNLTTALLNGLQYTSEADWYSGRNGEVENITVSVVDAGLTVTASNRLTVSAVNDAPFILVSGSHLGSSCMAVSVTCAASTCAASDAHSFSTITVADTDFSSSDQASEHLQLLVAANGGTVRLSSYSGLTVDVPVNAFSSSTAYPSVLVTGTMTDSLTALSGMTYFPTGLTTGTVDRMYVAVNDLSIYGVEPYRESDPDTLCIDITLTL